MFASAATVFIIEALPRLLSVLACGSFVAGALWTCA